MNGSEWEAVVANMSSLLMRSGAGLSSVTAITGARSRASVLLSRPVGFAEVLAENTLTFTAALGNTGRTVGSATVLGTNANVAGIGDSTTCG